MKKVLVTYATMAGSTAEVAGVVGEELMKQGLQVDVRPLAEAQSLDAYDALVVVGPMILGWHRKALRFLKQHRRDLKRLPLAVFISAMSLTQEQEAVFEGVQVVVDEMLPKAPETPGRLNLRERYARLSNYLKPILRITRPRSIGVFGGRLEYGRLPWWAVIFAMLLVQAPAGDRRNWEAIRAWAAGLPAVFELQGEMSA